MISTNPQPQSNSSDLLFPFLPSYTSHPHPLQLLPSYPRQSQQLPRACVDVYHVLTIYSIVLLMGILVEIVYSGSLKTMNTLKKRHANLLLTNILPSVDHVTLVIVDRCLQHPLVLPLLLLFKMAQQ